MQRTLAIVAVFTALGYAFGLGWEIALMLSENPDPEEETIGRQNLSVRRYAEAGITALESYLSKYARLAEYESDSGIDSAPPAGT